MLDAILALTSLPNLHPALVHFPLALLPLAVGVDAAFLATGRRWLERAAAGLWGLGAAAAWAALWSGEEAAEEVFNPPPAVERALVEHSDFAHWATWLAALVAALRLYLAWRDRERSAAPRRDPLRLGLLVAALGCLLLLVLAADHGGALVYRHGVGVSARTVGALPTP